MLPLIPTRKLIMFLAGKDMIPSTKAQMSIILLLQVPGAHRIPWSWINVTTLM